MESEKSFKEEKENHVVVVEIPSPDRTPADSQENVKSDSFLELPRLEMNLLANTSQSQTINPVQSPSSASAQVIVPSQLSVPSSKPSVGPSMTMRRRNQTQSSYAKPKSRVAEPPYPSMPKPLVETPQIPPVEETPQIPPAKSPHIALSPSPKHIASPLLASPSPKQTPKASGPITPRTPLMASVGGDEGEDEDDDNDDEVYKTENVKMDHVRKGKKVKVMDVLEWIAFVSIIVVLITSLTLNKLKDFRILRLQLWKWSVLVMVIFCGRLLTGWLVNTLVLLIEKNYVLKKKVLYFIFGLKKSVRVVIWLALILLAWALLINRGVERKEQTSKVLNYITRGIVSTLVAAVLWMAKTFLIKLIASSFHVRTFFDRIQESIFHQYILQVLSGPPLLADPESSRLSGKLSLKKLNGGNEANNGEVIDVDKLYRMKREKVSAWTMRGLIGVIRNSALPTMSEILDESIDEDSGEPRVIMSETEARDAAYRIFRNVARHGHKYIEEDDLLRFMPKEEVDNAIPLFEGAAELRRIKKSAFRNWVVKAYHERKCLKLSLNDAKTAVEELNKLASGLILLVIVIVWLLLMEITTTKVLVFISSQILLVVFMFGNTFKTVFEAIIFVFIVHPFDVGDRCVVDGAQMVVDEMNILTTIFLRPDNEKVYYPNAVLATKAISNFNRSPEMMGDSVEFSVDFSTSAESIAALRGKIKAYLDSKPQHWDPGHSVQIREIVDVDKMVMALYVTHTINFQNVAEKGERRSNLVFELKKILEELGIRYRLLPQEVQIKYLGGATPTPL